MYLKILMIGGLDSFVKCCSSIGELDSVVKNAVLLMVQRTELPPPPTAELLLVERTELTKRLFFYWWRGQSCPQDCTSIGGEDRAAHKTVLILVERTELPTRL